LASLLASWQGVGDHGPALMEIPWSADSTHLVRLMPLQDAKGSPQGWMMVVGDTTPLKRQVEFKLQLLKKIASKIHFPLTQAMFTLAELKDVLEEKGGRSAEIYYRLVQLENRIQEGTEELLAAVHLESGAGLRLIPVEVSALIDELIKNLWARLSREKGLLLEVNLTENLPPVHANPELLRRLLEGLLQRAAARNAPGHPLQLSTCVYQDQVWIKIRDGGPALAEAELPHIFEYGLDGPAAGGQERAGLDLALAKTMVDQMAGQVWLGGEGPLGSSVMICLPVLAAAEAPLEKATTLGRVNWSEVSPHAVN